jgi:heme oxygenase
MATGETHERLHTHEGFAAAAGGRIGRYEYRLLLARLLGFHRPFEAATAVAAQTLAFSIDLSRRRRAPLIECDLMSLGMTLEAIGELPVCGEIPVPASEAELFGALYVVEGSTLGGSQIAAALESVVPEARQFYRGYGERNGRMWRDFLMELERLSGRPAEEAAAISAAQQAFGVFEAWMNDWKDEPTCRETRSRPETADGGDLRPSPAASPAA